MCLCFILKCRFLILPAKSYLLIDDDPDDQLLFSLAVKQLNKSITYFNADNGPDAFKLLDQENCILPDIIFIDLNMPIINGSDCLIQLKANAKLSHIPVVMYSTSSREEDINKTKNLGAFAFITKPHTISDLTAQLNSFF